MNKTVSVLLFIIAAIFAASCSSDNGGNDNKDKKKIKTIFQTSLNTNTKNSFLIYH